MRAHPLLAGLAPDFAVLDDSETTELRDRAFRQALADWLARDGALGLAAAFGVEELQKAVVAVYDELRSRSPNPDLDYAYALVLVKQRKYDDALGMFSQIIKARKNDLAAYRLSWRYMWWQVLGSNQRRLSRRFYRPLPLATRATCLDVA